MSLQQEAISVCLGHNIWNKVWGNVKNKVKEKISTKIKEDFEDMITDRITNAIIWDRIGEEVMRRVDEYSTDTQ